MDWIGICIIVLISVYALMLPIGIGGLCILTWRYKKFYETTEEGRKLYCAIYTKDRLGSKHDWLVNRMSELRDKIDEFETYFPIKNTPMNFIARKKRWLIGANELTKWSRRCQKSIEVFWSITGKTRKWKLRRRKAYVSERFC